MKRSLDLTRGRTGIVAAFLLPTRDALGDFASGHSCVELRGDPRVRSSAAGPSQLRRIAADPRPYQLAAPLMMALRLVPRAPLIADDVGTRQTIEVTRSLANC